MKRLAITTSLLAGAAFAVWGVSTHVAAQGNQTLVIQGGTLIDGNGGAPVANSVIVIQGNRITAVGRAGQVQVPQGAFYAYPNVSCAFKGGISNSLQFCEKLLSEELVAVVPGEAFGTSSHVRISYATSMKELERGLDRIQRFIAARA